MRVGINVKITEVDVLQLKAQTVHELTSALSHSIFGRLVVRASCRLWQLP